MPSEFTIRVLFYSLILTLIVNIRYLGALKRMKNFGITERLRIYLKYLGHYILGIGFSCLCGTAISYYNLGLGILIGLLFAIILFFKLHINIGVTFIGSSKLTLAFKLLPIILIATLMVFLKMFVNETENNRTSCLAKISEEKRFLNYFDFTLWTTIFLWEIYYNLLTKILKGNNVSYS